VPHRRLICTIFFLRLQREAGCVPDLSRYGHFVGMTPLASARLSSIAPFASFALLHTLSVEGGEGETNHPIG
jgi:hypothetical protein